MQQQVKQKISGAYSYLKLSDKSNQSGKPINPDENAINMGCDSQLET